MDTEEDIYLRSQPITSISHILQGLFCALVDMMGTEFWIKTIRVQVTTEKKERKIINSY